MADLQTNVPKFDQPAIVVRRRFQDFAFLREHLAKAFPACIVPPIPDKHRLGKYLCTITIVEPRLIKQSTSKEIDSRPISSRNAEWSEPELLSSPG